MVLKTNIFRYVGAGGLIALLSELILSLYVLVATILDIIKIVRQKKR